MSYCRFTSDSDVYAYAHVGGFYRTHIAANRGLDAPLELPLAGQSFKDRGRKAFRDRLMSLQEQGYRVPQYAIDRINEEIEAAGRKRTALLTGDTGRG